MAVSKRLRYEILRRDGNTCQYCGAKAPEVRLTIDHVTPKALGGTDEPSNLVAACPACNAGKSASNPDAPLVAAVDQKAAQWAQAMEVAVTRRTAELSGMREKIGRFDQAWLRWADGLGDPAPREGNWRGSVTRFLSLGLDEQFLHEAVDTALGNQTVKAAGAWRYFCGICWREVEKLRELAAQALQDSPVESPATTDRMPQGAGLDPRFPALPLTDSFLAEALGVACTTPAAHKWVHRAFWSGMEAAYAAFLADPEAAGDEGRGDDPCLDAMSRAASVELDNAHRAMFSESRVDDVLSERFYRYALAHMGVSQEGIDLVIRAHDNAWLEGVLRFTDPDPLHPQLEPDQEALDDAVAVMLRRAKQELEPFRRSAGWGEA